MLKHCSSSRCFHGSWIKWNCPHHALHHRGRLCKGHYCWTDGLVLPDGCHVHHWCWSLCCQDPWALLSRQMWHLGKQLMTSTQVQYDWENKYSIFRHRENNLNSLFLLHIAHHLKNGSCRSSTRGFYINVSFLKWTNQQNIDLKSSAENLPVTYWHFRDHRKVAVAFTDMKFAFECQPLRVHACKCAQRYSSVGLCCSCTLKKILKNYYQMIHSAFSLLVPFSSDISRPGRGGSFHPFLRGFELAGVSIRAGGRMHRRLTTLRGLWLTPTLLFSPTTHLKSCWNSIYSHCSYCASDLWTSLGLGFWWTFCLAHFAPVK